MQTNINAQLFADEFNKLNYTSPDKKVETVMNYIVNCGLINRCMGGNVQQQQISQPQTVPTTIPISSTIPVYQTNPQSQTVPTTIPVYQTNQPQMISVPQQTVPTEIPQQYSAIPQQTVPTTVPNQMPVYQSPSKTKSPSKKTQSKKTPNSSPKKTNVNQFEAIPLDTSFLSPVQSNIISTVSKITIECSTGTFTYETPIDANILQEIINNIPLKQ